MKQSGIHALRAIVIALLVMTALISSAMAQSSSTETITVKLMPYDCAPVGTMGVDAALTDSVSVIEVPYGGGNSINPWLNFKLSVTNANCHQWSVTAQLNDFALTSDTAVTFPASTFVLTKSGTVSNNPQRWDATSQPQWVRALPPDLATGDPTMPNAVTFIESSPAGTAAGNEPLLSASTAEYGTPGNSTAYFKMKLRNVPSDVASGTFHSDITVTIQGGS